MTLRLTAVLSILVPSSIAACPSLCSISDAASVPQRTTQEDRVVTTDEHGRDIDRSIFTDAFAYRDGRQAINAQENKVEKVRRPT